MSPIKTALAAAVMLLGQTALSASAAAAPVLMISIDGLRADDLARASEHGLTLATLKRLADTGSAASSVRGVLPTVTYPSHTTMITGVHPARHGIAANITFDPEGKNMGGWMWYAQDIKVPTLWDRVHAQGGRVANIGWPVSVGATAIDYNIPEYWRVKIPEDEKLLRAVSTPGLPDEIARETGVPFARVAVDNNEAHEGMDEARMAWIPVILARHKPTLTLLHLVGLDGARHKYGPYSPQAKAALEGLDRGLGVMIDKARAAEPGLVVVLVSDHGFAAIDKSLNLVSAFAADGLVRVGANGKVADWSAFPWISGGSAAILLKNPADKATEEKVRTLLAKLAADPANGIDTVLDRTAVARLGGTAEAAFWVSMKSGYSVGGGLGKPLLQAAGSKGTHGYSPENPDMPSTFIISGPGIAHRALGAIDMRDIAPTVGAVLGAQLPAYDGTILPVLSGAQ